MSTQVCDLLTQSEASYFAGALKEAIAQLSGCIEDESFARFTPQDQAALRLQLGKLLVAAIFMDGCDPAAARQQLKIAKHCLSARALAEEIGHRVALREAVEALKTIFAR